MTIRKFREQAAHKLVWFGQAFTQNLLLLACIIQPGDTSEFLEQYIQRNRQGFDPAKTPWEQ